MFKLLRGRNSLKSVNSLRFSSGGPPGVGPKKPPTFAATIKMPPTFETGKKPNSPPSVFKAKLMGSPPPSSFAPEGSKFTQLQDTFKNVKWEEQWSDHEAKGSKKIQRKAKSSQFLSILLAGGLAYWMFKPSKDDTTPHDEPRPENPYGSQSTESIYSTEKKQVGDYWSTTSEPSNSHDQPLSRRHSNQSQDVSQHATYTTWNEQRGQDEIISQYQDQQQPYSANNWDK